MQNIDAVIVTYNRIEKLKRALDCYDAQTVPFRNVIVVDNHSTDGTDVLLREWKSKPAAYKKYLLTLESNKGGSGGFYEGERLALELGADWVFISDDDAYPAEDLVNRFNVFYAGHSHEQIAAVCSSVWDMSNSLMLSCRSCFSIEKDTFCLKEVSAEMYEKPFFTFNCLSYVGAFLSARALNKAGLVNKGFFIYQDDVEHSVRLSKFGIMYCIPGMVVVHDSMPLSQTSQADLRKSLWKEYYAVRNRVYLVLRHFPQIGKKYVIKLLGGIKAHKDSSLSSVNKMSLEGINDAIKNRLGIHSFYKPGLLIDNNQGLPYPKYLWKAVYVALRVRSILFK